MPSPPTKKAKGSKPKPKKDTPTNVDVESYTDDHNIVYFGDEAQVTVSRDVKLSRNYQSIGLHAGISFKTKASLAEDVIPAAIDKLRNVLTKPLQQASEDLDDL